MNKSNIDDRTEYYSTPTNQLHHQSNIFTPSFEKFRSDSEFGELPLLQELEIYPTRVIEKSLAVINPFYTANRQANEAEYLFRQTDLAGPIAFYLALALFLFISDARKDIFGYVYGVSCITVIFMYILLKLMASNSQNYITLSSVTSILGYSILPIVWLSIPGVFFSLNNRLGISLACAAVFMSTGSASRYFVMMTGEKNQRFLIAYPCALVYIVFTLLVLF